MTLFETIAVALSMYSAIPMPQFEWNPRNMRYAMAAFPLVGILCGAAIALVTDWRVFAIAMPVFILLFFATRLVSLASLTAVACFGVLYAVFYPARPEIWIITICEAAFAFVMHRGNIVRLLHGQERKTYFHRAKNERNE